MKKDVKNVAASVRQRLLNRARETNRPFDELLQYYAMERFLYRLSQSDYSSVLILKGALMFVVWDAPRSRVTRDIDLLGHLQNSIENVVDMIKEVCQLKVESDGLVFAPDTVEGVRIKEDADYEGVRVRFLGGLERTRIHMQIDFGFGDTVFPIPEIVEYPTILDMLPPKLIGYPRETVVAEKFEAMVNLGMLNSRLKDFYDLWLLANQFDFDGQKLTRAVKETFSHRATSLASDPIALTGEFSRDPVKKVQWSAFLRKTRLEYAPKDLTQVVATLRVFLPPIIEPYQD